MHTAMRPSTRDQDYADRLVRLQTKRWKRLVDVQLPYRLHLRRLGLGRTLDVGCGIGRQLAHLPAGSVGVDHNAHAVAYVRSLGLEAYLPEELAARLPAAGQFDSVLVAHVLEHMDYAAAERLLASYADYLAPGGRVVLICPQERGYRTDATHVEFRDAAQLERLLGAAGCAPIASYSFPLPRAFGAVFPYNEFVVIGRRSATPPAAPRQ